MRNGNNFTLKAFSCRSCFFSCLMRNLLEMVRSVSKKSITSISFYYFVAISYPQLVVSLASWYEKEQSYITMSVSQLYPLYSTSSILSISYPFLSLNSTRLADSHASPLSFDKHLLTDLYHTVSCLFAIESSVSLFLSIIMMRF